RRATFPVPPLRAEPTLTKLGAAASEGLHHHEPGAETWTPDRPSCSTRSSSAAGPARCARSSARSPPRVTTAPPSSASCPPPRCSSTCAWRPSWRGCWSPATSTSRSTASACAACATSTRPAPWRSASSSSTPAPGSPPSPRATRRRRTCSSSRATSSTWSPCCATPSSPPCRCTRCARRAAAGCVPAAVSGWPTCRPTTSTSSSTPAGPPSPGSPAPSARTPPPTARPSRAGSTTGSGEMARKAAAGAARDDVEVLLERLGVPIDPELLVLALTHRSFAHEAGGIPTNERLEFLGDTVLGLVVTERLFRNNAGTPEGDLARMRAAVVSQRALAGVARALDLGEFILLGRGELVTGGRGTGSVLSDTLEALIGAAYLCNGLGPTRAMIERLVGDLLDEAATLGAGLDWKTSLQELVAARGLPAPTYQVVGAGPDHARTFSATVVIGDRDFGTGSGTAKKVAEQQAAQDAYARLSAEEPVEQPADGS